MPIITEIAEAQRSRDDDREEFAASLDITTPLIEREYGVGATMTP